MSFITQEYQVLDHGYVRYVDHMGSDQRIVESARISYKSPSKGEEQDKKLLQYLWKNKHFSPFEMCQITMNIKMPIFVMRQYIRHRTQSVNEVSARYTQLPKEYYIPKKWRYQSRSNKQGSSNLEFDIIENANITDKVIEVCDNSYELYEKLIGDGVARELARMVLPVNMYTEIYCTWDLRCLLHFLQLRDEDHAQYEIQEYAKAIKKILIEIFPQTMDAYEKYKWELTEIK